MYASGYRTDRSSYDISRRGPPIGYKAPSTFEDFYVDVLGGQEVWQTERTSANDSRWFLVGATLIEVKLTPNTPAPVELEVDEPDELLERAWDAGYTVEVVEQDARQTMSLIDPFGRRINLVPRLGSKS